MYDSLHKYNYDWTLKDANFTKDKGKVFSCFACGGGSTMGYKLAGFDVLGCNEIDKKMMDCYIENHKPKYSYLEPIQEFKLRKDLPKELYNLDILDGSPPCSSFSIAGNREKDWGKSKKFREGQSKQILDTLFFDFIDLAKELQPKIVIAENVKGILIGGAKKYVNAIYKDFDKAGYILQHFVLDASLMGVPQRRQRVFFIGLRKDLINIIDSESRLLLNIPLLDLHFNEKPIVFSEIQTDDFDNKLQKSVKLRWEIREYGDINLTPADKKLRPEKYANNDNAKAFFNCSLLHNNKTPCTITTQILSNILYDIPRFMNNDEIIKAGSFPSDYDFQKTKPVYIIGMSVPPIMTAQIANRIYEQWINKINNLETQEQKPCKNTKY